ncbi:MAG: PDK repeat-containing protein, partial [Planctomycetota bacterium]
AQLWMYEYLAWSIQHANDLGFLGGTRFRDQVVTLQTELFVNPSYNREYAAPGRLVIGQVSADGNSTRYFTSLNQVLSATRQGIAPGTFTGYYGVEARLMLLLGISSGADGSNGYRGQIRAALNFLNDPLKHPGMFRDPLERSGFGLSGPDHL